MTSHTGTFFSHLKDIKDSATAREMFNASLAPPTGPATWYELSCHCGAIQVNIELPPLYAEDAAIFPMTVSKCNCTICTINGYLMTYPNHETGVKWIKGEDTIKTYSGREGSMTKHGFCGECGSSVCVWRFGLDDVAFNARLIKDIDPDKLSVRQCDGRHKL